jgi:hypothetical protein
MTAMETTLLRVHQRNIERYRRLLRTRLTKLERDFVMRRLAEEQGEIARLKARGDALGAADAAAEFVAPPPGRREVASLGSA